MKKLPLSHLVKLCAVLAVALIGCGARPLTVDGHQIHEGYWNVAVAQVRPRAAFDLGCPAESLSFTLLRMERREAAMIGASGCGHRGTYVRRGSSSADSRNEEWLLNGSTQ